MQLIVLKVFVVFSSCKPQSRPDGYLARFCQNLAKNGYLARSCKTNGYLARFLQDEWLSCKILAEK